MAKLLKIRKPKLRLTAKGPRLTRPSARIGGNVGLNVSSRGVHASIQKGRRKNKSCSLFLLMVSLAFLSTALIIKSILIS